MGNNLKLKKKRKTRARPRIRPIEHIPKHCDDYIDDETQPEALRKYLARARMPAHGMLDKSVWPELYADFEGKTVRVVMASRLGSIGWTHNLSAEIGYERQGWVENLINFRDKP